jgi:hypothetical protein
MMHHNLIRLVHHLEGLAFMTRLATALFWAVLWEDRASSTNHLTKEAYDCSCCSDSGVNAIRHSPPVGQKPRILSLNPGKQDRDQIL